VHLGKNLPEGEADNLARQFPGVKFSLDLGPEDYVTVDAVFTGGRLDDETVARLSALRWIQTTYGGGQAFLTPDVLARGITVTCSRGVQASPLSEYTEACVFAFAKKLSTLSRLKDDRRWDENLALDTLSGKVAGLLGLGAVGSAVAQRLHKQGMKVRAIRRKVDDVPSYVDRVDGMDHLAEMLSQVDYLIIGLPAVVEMNGLLGEDALRSMKPTSYLINLVTRGIVEDAVLLRALREGWIAGAACNVFETNPLPEDSELWDAPNLIISPSVAQTDPQRWQKLKKVFTDNLDRHLQGAAMENIVDAKGA
jgi:phosphoglycerate dehydrogenase-like enzyme